MLDGWCLSFFINPRPIGASEIGLGMFPGTNSSTTPFSERGLHFSRWLLKRVSLLLQEDNSFFVASKLALNDAFSPWLFTTGRGHKSLPGNVETRRAQDR